MAVEDPAQADGQSSIQPISEVERLLPIERSFARKRFDHWYRQQSTTPSQSSDESRLKALHLTYINIAALWLNILVVPFIVAACLWSLHSSNLIVGIASFASAVATVPLAALLVRWRQAYKFWPGRVPTRPE